MSDAPSKPGAGDDDGDKRIALRLRKYIDVVVEDPLSSTLFRGAVADISLTGMRVIVDQYLPVAARYLFTMKRNPFLKLRGQIRWVRPMQGETHQIGVLIIEATADDKKRLQNFLDLENKRPGQ